MPLSTQKFIEVEQIKDGVLIMKDHTLRGVMMVSSVNFALKSGAEQQATIFQFQNFLNSLDFTCQMLIVSRKLNITGYLDKLKDIEEKQENELLKNQTRDYHQFVEKLVAGSSIMSKNFYLIVPFYLSEGQEAVAGGSGIFQFKTAPPLTEELFQKYKSQLYQRMEFLALGLRRCGVWSIPLKTEELAELMWSVYHPAEAQVGYYPEIPPELIV